MVSPLPPRLQHVKVATMEVETRNENLPSEGWNIGSEVKQVWSLLGICDKIALQVVALHERFVVKVGYTCVFHVATHIKHLIGGLTCQRNF